MLGNTELLLNGMVGYIRDNKFGWFMTRQVLDVESVLAFVTIADFQSFTRAAEALGTTQGAISVKLKRLEDRLGYKLLPQAGAAVGAGQCLSQSGP
jgi:hypothetical protein